MELIPTTVSSITISGGGGVLSTKQMHRLQQMFVVDIGFYNQGTGSIAIIKFDGGEIRLASGPKNTFGAGASWCPFLPSGFIDCTDYRVTFEADGSGLPQVNNLFIGYRYLIKKC